MPPTASKAREPEDIFAGTGLGKGGPNYPVSPETAASIAESPARGLGRKLVRLLFLAVGAAIIVAAGYFGYRYFLAAKAPAAPPAENTNANNQISNPDANQPIANSPINVPSGNENANINVETNQNANLPLQAPLINENANVPPAVIVLPAKDDPNSTQDSDGDGLTDYQEAQVYRTDLNKADTDGDGLSDRDEAVTWKTDPLNADTDGDGYSDGSEVKNGYNPLGTGKLLPPVAR